MRKFLDFCSIVFLCSTFSFFISASALAQAVEHSDEEETDDPPAAQLRPAPLPVRPQKHKAPSGPAVVKFAPTSEEKDSEREYGPPGVELALSATVAYTRLHANCKSESFAYIDALFNLSTFSNPKNFSAGSDTQANVSIRRIADENDANIAANIHAPKGILYSASYKDEKDYLSSAYNKEKYSMLNKMDAATKKRLAARVLEARKVLLRDCPLGPKGVGDEIDELFNTAVFCNYSGRNPAEEAKENESFVQKTYLDSSS